MSKFFVGLAVGLLAAWGFAVSQAHADDLSVFQKQAINPVVQLERNCSGVVFNTSDVSATWIVTANHCVDGEQSGHINIDTKDRAKLIDTQTYVFDVKARSISTDLAVLKLRKSGLMLEGATIAQEDPQEGEKVWTVGYPLGLTRTVTEGFFGGFMSLSPDMGFDEDGNGREVYRATPAIFGGNSGGGFFVKRGDHYELVGITDAGFRAFFVAGFYNTQKDMNELIRLTLSAEQRQSVTIEQKKQND